MGGGWGSAASHPAPLHTDAILSHGPPPYFHRVQSRLDRSSFLNCDTTITNETGARWWTPWRTR